MADEIRFTDHEERVVTLSAPAERIASIPISDGLDADRDRWRHGTARGDESDGEIRHHGGHSSGGYSPKPARFPSDITAPNFIPNVEELARVNPDLVIQWAGRGPDYVDPITNAGLDLMTIMYGTEERTREYMTMAATAMGKPERIEQIIDWRAAVEADIAARTATIPEG